MIAQWAQGCSDDCANAAVTNNLLKCLILANSLCEQECPSLRVAKQEVSVFSTTSKRRRKLTSRRPLQRRHPNQWSNRSKHQCHRMLSRHRLSWDEAWVSWSVQQTITSMESINVVERLWLRGTKIWRDILVRSFRVCQTFRFKNSANKFSNEGSNLRMESIRFLLHLELDRTKLKILFSVLRTTFGAAAVCQKISHSATVRTWALASNLSSFPWMRRQTWCTCVAANSPRMHPSAMAKLARCYLMGRSSRRFPKWSKRKMSKHTRLENDNNILNKVHAS